MSASSPGRTKRSSPRTSIRSSVAGSRRVPRAPAAVADSASIPATASARSNAALSSVDRWSATGSAAPVAARPDVDGYDILVTLTGIVGDTGRDEVPAGGRPGGRRDHDIECRVGARREAIDPFRRRRVPAGRGDHAHRPATASSVRSDDTTIGTVNRPSADTADGRIWTVTAW